MCDLKMNSLSDGTFFDEIKTSFHFNFFRKKFLFFSILS